MGMRSRDRVGSEGGVKVEELGMREDGMGRMAEVEVEPYRDWGGVKNGGGSGGRWVGGD